MTNITRGAEPTTALGGQNESDVSSRELAQEALRNAETAWYQYAAGCDIGEERTRAFEVYENVRTAQRAY